jgi:hypothetical protein
MIHTYPSYLFIYPPNYLSRKVGNGYKGRKVGELKSTHVKYFYLILCFAFKVKLLLAHPKWHMIFSVKFKEKAPSLYTL